MKHSAISLRVKQLRNQLNLNYLDFAAKCGLTVASVYRIENSEVVPRINTLKQIINNTGCNEDWLLTGKGQLIIITKDTKADNEKDKRIKELEKQVAFLQGVVNNLTANK